VGFSGITPESRPFDWDLKTSAGEAVAVVAMGFIGTNVIKARQLPDTGDTYPMQH
jgi:hypothetical protein